MPASTLAVSRAMLRALRTNAAFFYRHEATWSGGTTCRFSVVDPSPVNVAQVQAAVAAEGKPLEDARVLTVHVDDAPPKRGEFILWEDGRLEVIGYGQVSDFTGTALGVAVFTR